MSMKKGDMIFTYGTLRLGESADLSRTGKALFVQPDRINGKLYRTSGWFPGVKIDDEDDSVVHGDVFIIEDDALPAQLDRYEGYPSLFDRRQVTTKGGKTVWVYTYNPPVGEETRIENGQWER